MKHYGTDITDELPPHKNIKKLAINKGAVNLGFITEDNSIYVSGGNDQYQLGRGDDITPQHTFKKLIINDESLTPNEQVKNCYILGKLIFVLYESGKLFSSGVYTGNGKTSSDNKKIFTKIANDIDYLIYSENASDSIDKMTIGAKTLTGEFLLWGNNSHHQVSKRDNLSFYTPVYVNTTPPYNGILNMWIIGNGKSCVFVEDSNHDIWATGFNAQGQLGLYNTNKINKFTKVSFCNRANAGRVIKIFGSNIVHKPLRTIASGTNTGAVTGFLFENGQIYMVGCNKHYQLGDNDKHTHLIPFKIDLAEPVNKIYDFGGAHLSIYVFHNNKTASRWGYNEYGQLRTGDTKAIVHPLLMQTHTIEEIYPVTPVGKWADESAVFITTVNNQILATGHNINGNLGTGTYNKNLNIFTLVDFPSHIGKILDIQSCGYDGKHSSILLTDKGEVYTCGSNNLGQLGTGNTNSSCTFTNIIF